MAYNLPQVDPFVVAAANELGSRFGIKTIGGYRPGPPTKYGAYDHPLGLALDLMTNNLGTPTRSHPTGQQLAEYVVANHQRLGVNFVIWNRQSWHRSRAGQPGAWKPYSGDSDHTDHVHVSFLNPADRARSGAGGAAPGGTPTVPVGIGIFDPTDNGLIGAIREAAGGLRDIAKGANAVGDLAKKAMWLALPSSQVRLVSGAIGVGLLLIGVLFLAREVRS